MNNTVSAACEALDFFLSTSEIDFNQKKILLLQAPPAGYLKHLKGATINAITFDASVNQSWLQRSVDSSNPLECEYDVVIQFGTKSDSETQIDFSNALSHLKKEGLFIGIIHNRMGASRYRKLLGASFPELDNISKSKCRVFFSAPSTPPSPLDTSLLQKPKAIDDTNYFSIPGIYGEGKIDAGSKMLADILKSEHWSGNGADIGCGYGYLSGEILSTRHRIKQLWLYDIDSRALEMAQNNLDGKTELHPHWVDITQQIPCDRPLHWAVMNPPFHSGTTQDFALGQKFIQQAASILRPGAPLFMVANTHLPYEETLFSEFRSVVKINEENGFKCFRAIK